ncbi:MAG: prepilin-type N-terminal cleavage/methylation domain-containing protein [Thermodesulfobacteriota bacterium]|nr:prepilin-type N-terminal cleavage/methylation domain-containing protein [Thermodesulfobacteriota bacterium]
MIDMKKNNEKGFILIEILIAITVFAVGILAVGSMQITAIKGNSFAKELTKASILAQDRMEKLISLTYADELNNETNDNGVSGLDDTDTTADHKDTNNPVDGKYNICWNIAKNSPINNTETIKVIITWTYGNAQKTIFLTSMKADII